LWDIKTCMNKVSGEILTHNNSRTIAAAIDSIKNIIDELIIVDDFSNDDTIAIIEARYPAVRIFKRKLDRYDAQRNFAIEKSSYDWILMIDSDEVVDKVLGDAIKKELRAPAHETYSCVRLNLAFGDSSRDKMIRPILFKNDTRFVSAIHEFVPNIKISYLDGLLIHDSWVGVEAWITKMNMGSTRHAEKWVLEGREYGRFKIFLLALSLPPYEFFKHFIIDKRFRSFYAGFLFSVIQTFYWILILSKYYEIRYLKEGAIKKEKI